MPFGGYVLRMGRLGERWDRWIDDVNGPSRPDPDARIDECEPEEDEGAELARLVVPFLCGIAVVLVMGLAGASWLAGFAAFVAGALVGGVLVELSLRSP